MGADSHSKQLAKIREWATRTFIDWTETGNPAYQTYLLKLGDAEIALMELMKKVGDGRK